MKQNETVYFSNCWLYKSLVIRGVLLCKPSANAQGVRQSPALQKPKQTEIVTKEKPVRQIKTKQSETE